MAKLLQDPDYESNRKKYGHDLSRVLKFSSSVGHLLPVYYDLALPGDKYRMNTEMFTQVTDIVSPAMMHVENHVDWFFVPLQSISQMAGSVLFGVDDIHSSLIGNVSENVIPMLNLNVYDEDLQAFDGGDVTYYNLYNADVGDNPLVITDEQYQPNIFNAARLAELLGFTNRFWLERGGMSNNSLVNPMLLCAYHKIYYDHYRITDRERNRPDLYNLDKFIESGNITDYKVQQELWKMHYRPWDRDFFQITKVAPMVDKGSVGMLPQIDANDTLAHFNNWLTEGNNLQPNIGVNQGTVFAPNPNNTASLRGSFAVEKLMELTRRAAKHYDSQVLAHFGFKIPKGISGECYRLGSEKSVISINEVFATAAGTNGEIGTTLGEKGGRAAGYSAAGDNIEFTAPCHGIIMALYSGVPKADYECQGLDRINTYRVRYDYFFPSLDNLGMQPLFLYQTDWQPDSPEWNARVLGWQYRYQENKVKFNLVCGAFNTTEYQYWTVKRSFVGTAMWQYYISPAALDNVLLVHFMPSDDQLINKESCFARDPFLHWFKFNVYKSSVMSTFSLPRL